MLLPTAHILAGAWEKLTPRPKSQRWHVQMVQIHIINYHRRPLPSPDHRRHHHHHHSCDDDDDDHHHHHQHFPPHSEAHEAPHHHDILHI